MKKLLLFVSAVPLIFGMFASTADAAQNHCIVQKGDSMYKIAQRYNIPFAEILRLNKHFKDPHMIYPLDKILLPHGTGASDNNNSGENDEYEDISPPSDDSGANSDVSQQAKDVLSLVNAERKKQGLNPLPLSDKLTAVANEKARDMAVNNYFSHTSPTYGSPWQMLQQYGIRYKTAGENIAYNQRSAKDVMDAWLHSSGHRANILNADFTDIGIGYFDENTRPYWTQEFIGR